MLIIRKRQLKTKDKPSRSVHIFCRHFLNAKDVWVGAHRESQEGIVAAVDIDAARIDPLVVPVTEVSFRLYLQLKAYLQNISV